MDKKDSIFKNKKKMKIFMDYQTLMSSRSGISRYAYELNKAFKRIANTKMVVPHVFCVNQYFNDGKKILYPLNPKLTRYYDTINKNYTIFKLFFSRYDIFHPTYFSPYFLKHNKGKLVVTVYDMIHEIYKKELDSNDLTIGNKKRLIYAADRIIAISENTKKDIMKFYPDIPSEKIDVIWLASNNMESVNASDEKICSQPYILYVGSRVWYKNFRFFYEEMEPLLAQFPDLHLCCIGGGAFNEAELEYMKPYKDRVLQLNATDEQLKSAYQNAVCFVFPSLYEGFGIPTLEAFACECPVVLCASSSLPEVGGSAALYFSPQKRGELEAQVKKFLVDEELRNIYVSKGKERLKLFSWEITAMKTYECYKKVLGIEEECENEVSTMQ